MTTIEFLRQFRIGGYALFDLMIKNIFKNHFFPIIFLILFCLFQMKAFFIPAWPKSHDGIFHVIRMKDYFRELKHGQFPVRWVDDLDYGYGLPLFTYIYPGPYILTSIPMAVSGNEVVSYKLVMIIGYALGVIGIYALFARKNIFFALAAGILFGLTPYIFLDVFVRGALAEILAIGFMPWALYGLTTRKYSLGAISLCFVLISHNFLGIFFLLFLLLFFIWNGTFDRKTLQAVILGIGLSAFFLLPMIIESRYINSGFGNSYAFDYQNHFVYPFQLLYGKWGFGYSVLGPKDGMSFQLGFANILIIIGSCFTLSTVKQKKYLLFFLLVVFGSIFLTLTFSQFIWDQIKILHGLTLFPWRLLFVPAILCPQLYFLSITQMYSHHPWRAYVITVALIALAAINVRNYRQATEYVSTETYRGMVIADEQKTTTILRNEISPIWSPDIKGGGNRVIHTSTKGTIPADVKPESITFTVESDKEPVTILKNYFPGWKLTDLTRSKEIPVQPDPDGNVTASLPTGTYTYAYGQTNIERYANIISLCSFLIILGISMTPFLKKFFNRLRLFLLNYNRL